MGWDWTTRGGIDRFQNRVSLGTINIYRPGPRLPQTVLLPLITAEWVKVKPVLDQLEGLTGLKVKPFELDHWGPWLQDEKNGLEFSVLLDLYAVTVHMYWASRAEQAGQVKVPDGREKYREFLTRLNGWSNSAHNLVPDVALKQFNTDNPKKPSVVHKDFETMAKKSKSDVEAFRAWAKNAAAKYGSVGADAVKALADIDKTAKLKPTDPARAKALKAVNDSLKSYYDSF